jgi:GGDEF domain-containing protein
VLDIDDLKDLRFRATRPPSDWVLGRAVQSMRAHLPAGALTARVGASQLVALVANVEERATAKAIRAIQEELHAAHIDTTAGFAMREPGRGLLGAWINALTRLARPAPKRAPVARRPLPAKRAAPADATPPQDTAAATIETLSSRWDW